MITRLIEHKGMTIEYEFIADLEKITETGGTDEYGIAERLTRYEMTNMEIDIINCYDDDCIDMEPTDEIKELVAKHVNHNIGSLEDELINEKY